MKYSPRGIPPGYYLLEKISKLALTRILLTPTDPQGWGFFETWYKPLSD